jgi:signal transduction histidine kinase
MTVSFILLEVAISSYINHQITRSLEREMQQFIRIDKSEGRQDLIKIIERKTRIDAELTQEHDYYWLLISKDNKKIAGNLIEWPSHLNTDHEILDIIIHPSELSTLGLTSFFDKDHNAWPMVSTTLEDGAKILVARRIPQADDLQIFILTEVGIVLFISIILALFLGWRLGRKMLGRLDKINKVLKDVAKKDLTQRIVTMGYQDEFEELINHVNDMLERIERLFNGIQEVTDNVAHDLRQPLSRLRNRIEVTLLESRDKESYEEALEKSVEDIDSIIKTFNALLEIAQAEAGSYVGEWVDINLSQLLQDLSELYYASAEDQSINLSSKIRNNIFIKGNRHLIIQSICNLIDNAIKYTPKNGLVTVSLDDTGNNKIILSVIDTGIGIPESSFQHVIERFVRLDKDRGTPGSGLGLSLVKAVASLHKARLLFENNNPGLKVSLEF